MFLCFYDFVMFYIAYMHSKLLVWTLYNFALINFDKMKFVLCEDLGIVNPRPILLCLSYVYFMGRLGKCESQIFNYNGV